jgi:hypothetical protein
MASGSNRAHSATRRPGNSNKVTAAALALPTTTVPAATMRHRRSVVQA